jgi:hypothetical protein
MMVLLVDVSAAHVQAPLLARFLRISRQGIGKTCVRFAHR